MIPVYFFFRKTDINAVNSPFLQILLHGLRTSNKAKQVRDDRIVDQY